ncbi:hypothetical protein [Gallaecimonas sp. GXIMD4217]|uniref:hypothetical protein n=1 Tax=Gallaecimonas sp. GXIMD4217 TaxID=3131927 RepID=UPI00311AC359
MKTRLALALGATLLAAPALADNPYLKTDADKWQADPGFSFTLFGGFTTGGDKIAEISFTDGTTDSVRFGGRYHFGIGGVYEVPDSRWLFGANLGYHVNWADDADNEVTIKRYTLEAIPYYRLGRHLLGAGISWHFGGEVEVDEQTDIFGFKEAKMDDEIGFLVEYNYQLYRHGWVGFRYQIVDYDIDEVDGVGIPAVNFDADHWGIYYRAVF